jgi:hypothetical protein
VGSDKLFSSNYRLSTDYQAICKTASPGCRLGATNPRQRRSDRTTKNLALCFIFQSTLFYEELMEFNTFSFSYSALLKVEVFLPSLLSS